MKAELEKKIKELNKSKVPIVAIDPVLNKYQGKILFPKKLALAEEQLKGVKLPKLRSTAANKSIAVSGADTAQHQQQ